MHPPERSIPTLTRRSEDLFQRLLCSTVLEDLLSWTHSLQVPLVGDVALLLQRPCVLASFSVTLALGYRRCHLAWLIQVVVPDHGRAPSKDHLPSGNLVKS